jgi:uncharacterized protein DUF6680
LDPNIAATNLVYWAELSAVASCMAAIGTFLAPLFALRVSSWLDRRRENERRKFELFQVLMQWRAIPYIDAPVRAFNSIDTVFHDVQAVRDAWSDLFSSYLDSRLGTPEGARIRQDKLNSLLQEMAKHLGYKRTFSKADFERVYNPEALGRHFSILFEQQRQAYEDLLHRQKANQKLPEAEESSHKL